MTKSNYCQKVCTSGKNICKNDKISVFLPRSVKFIGLVIQRMIEDKFQNHSKHKRQFNMLEMFGLEIIILFVVEVGSNQRRWTWTGDFKYREVKTGFCRNRSLQTGSSGTLIGWKSGQTTFVPLWDWMEGAWLRTQKELIRGVGSRGIQIDKNVLVSFLMFKFRTAFKPHTSGLK